MLCHDAKFLCQSYVMCVLETKICCLQDLVKESDTKKWDTNILKCFIANRMFSWDRHVANYIWGGSVWLREQVFLTHLFSWHHIYFIMKSVQNEVSKYLFLILFIYIWQMDSKNSRMNQADLTALLQRWLERYLLYREPVLLSMALEVSLNKTFGEVHQSCTPARPGKWKTEGAECFFCSYSRFSIQRDRKLEDSSLTVWRG